METKTKPNWITKELWSAVPSIDWWADSKKRMEYIAQSKPVRPESISPDYEAEELEELESRGLNLFSPRTTPNYSRNRILSICFQ